MPDLLHEKRNILYKHDPCVQLTGHDIIIDRPWVDRVAAMSRHESSHGRASLQRRPVFLWWKQSRNSESCKVKGVKTQQGQKSKSSLLFWLPLLWSLRKARCDFLNTAGEKRLDFHKPADLLRAGVSQIQFQTIFFSPFPIHLPAASFVALANAYQELNWSKSVIDWKYSCGNIT